VRLPLFTPSFESLLLPGQAALKEGGRRVPIRIGLLLLSLGLILIADFSAKQVANRGKEPKSVPIPAESPSKVSHRQFRHDYHHGFVPNSAGSELFGPYLTPYFVNSLGMRDAEIRAVSPERPPGGRVLLLGDSYIDGVGVEFSQTVAGQVKAILAAPGMEILNGGVASYSPTLMAARLKSWVEKDGLEFEIAVVFIDISDLDNELRLHLDSAGNFLKEDNPAFLSELEKCKEAVWVRSWMEAHVEKNFVLLGAAFRNLRLLYEGWGSPGSDTPYVFSDWPAYRGPLEPWIQDGIRRQRQAMDHILGLCKKQGARLVVVVYPWLEQINRGQLEDRHTRSWEEWAERNQVPFLSLYPDFIERRKSIADYTLSASDGHWNARGSRLVAERLVKFLSERGLLPAANGRQP
jgi:hypothetical protein